MEAANEIPQGSTSKLKKASMLHNKFPVRFLLWLEQALTRGVGCCIDQFKRKTIVHGEERQQMDLLTRPVLTTLSDEEPKQ